MEQTALPVPDDFNFPFEPYEIQKLFMENLFRVIDAKKIGIFESPTGTGKSLTLLCASLRWLFDFNVAKLQDLRNTIQCMGKDVLNLISSSANNSDWLSDQYDLIQKKQFLTTLEKQLEQQVEYNKKMEEIKNRVIQESKKFKGTLKKTDEENLFNELFREDKPNEEFLITDYIDEISEPVEETENFEKPEIVQIFFCSRTHSQLSQIVKEAKNTTFKDQLRTISLASRQNYCINQSVRKLQNNNLINEQCLELQKSTNKSTKVDKDANPVKKQMLKKESCGCPHFKNKTGIENLKNLSLSKILDIEELVKVAEVEKACPYYASRQAVNDSQLIMVPYQILFNQATRDQCGLNLKGNVVIIDEAHNLLDTISQIHTASITLKQLREAHQQLFSYKMKYVKRFCAANLLKINQIIFVNKQLMKFLEKSNAGKKSGASKTLLMHEILSDAEIHNINLIEILKFCDQTYFAQKVFGFSKKPVQPVKTPEVTGINSTKSFLSQLQEKSEKKSKKIDITEVVEMQHGDEKKDKPTNVLRILLQFFECLTQQYDDGRVLLSFDDNVENSSMKYLLLDASGPFQSIIKECRSIILAGGTMKPTSDFTEQLFKSCKDRVEVHCFGHVVDDKAILPLTLSQGCSGKEFRFTHQSKGDMQMLKELAITIKNICYIVPGGVICFFTSYDNLNAFHSLILKDNGILKSIEAKKQIFVEPRASGKVDKTLEDYAKSISRCKNSGSTQNGAIMLSVIGGKLSEGMNFCDDLGRCVIIVGLPYPNKFNSELLEKINYLNRNVSPTAGNEYYENLCMKAVNQSIGRSIRHINDYAVTILIDARYQQLKVIDKLPEWIRKNLKCLPNYGKTHCEINNFFKGKF